MTAGTTSEKTFKVRAGRTSAGTFYMNRVGNADYYNSTMVSGIIVMEVQA